VVPGARLWSGAINQSHSFTLQLPLCPTQGQVFPGRLSRLLLLQPCRPCARSYSQVRSLVHPTQAKHKIDNGGKLGSHPNLNLNLKFGLFDADSL
jgi:hypothetical protein